MAVADPLTLLPPEIVLRILEYSSLSAVASLTRVSRPWNTFIEERHQDAIYSSECRTTRPHGAKDFSFLQHATSFSKYFEGATSWKDLCKRQTLLTTSWDSPQPMTRESVLQVGNDPVWRFRPDFKRRFFVSTSQAGGLNVTDMDTGALLWRLSSTLDIDDEGVRPYAHLEYQDGLAVFDREGDAVEVWQTDLHGLGRGEFRRIAILPHDCQTRGFQLSYNSLCVVSTRGQAFIYDMTKRPPQLTKHLEIEEDAVGHLDQDADVVMYSMGSRGYHIYDKTSGELIGILKPSYCNDDHRYHIEHPRPASSSSSSHGPTARLFPPGAPRTDRLEPITLVAGPMPAPTDLDHVWHGEDQWGAGMISGDLVVGFSRAGRVFICSDWRKALKTQQSLHENSVIVECETDGSTFDLGGWLSVRDHRVMFEIKERIYIIVLDKENKIQGLENPQRPSYSLLTSSAPQLAVPVSFMALFDDCIMTTYTTLGWRQPARNAAGSALPQQQHEGPARIFPTKAIRIVSLAPQLGEREGEATLWESSQEAKDMERTQTGLLQLVSMLGDELDNEEDDIGLMETDFHGAD